MNNQRMCVACKKRCNKDNLIRIEVENQNAVIATQKIENSRSIYLCFDANCLEKAKKSKIMEKMLKTEIKQDFYENLKDYIVRKTNG